MRPHFDKVLVLLMNENVGSMVAEIRSELSNGVIHNMITPRALMTEESKKQMS